MIINEDFFDSDIDVAVKDNSVEDAKQDKFNLVLTVFSHNKVRS